MQRLLMTGRRSGREFYNIIQASDHLLEVIPVDRGDPTVMEQTILPTREDTIHEESPAN